MFNESKVCDFKLLNVLISKLFLFKVIDVSIKNWDKKKIIKCIINIKFRNVLKIVIV